MGSAWWKHCFFLDQQSSLCALETTWAESSRLCENTYPGHHSRLADRLSGENPGIYIKRSVPRLLGLLCFALGWVGVFCYCILEKACEPLIGDGRDLLESGDQVSCSIIGTDRFTTLSPQGHRKEPEDRLSLKGSYHPLGTEPSGRACLGLQVHLHPPPSHRHAETLWVPDHTIPC